MGRAGCVLSESIIWVVALSAERKSSQEWRISILVVHRIEKETKIGMEVGRNDREY